MKPRYKNVMTMSGVAVLAIGLVACGGSSTKAPEPTAQEMCTADGGRWNADMTCTSAADLAKEATAERARMQRAAITEAIGDAETAVAAVNNDSTDAQVSAADTAIATARSAIMAAADVPAAERASDTRTVDAIADRLDEAKMDRQTAMDDAEKKANEAMAATAAKLYAGIGAQMGAGDGTTFAATDRDAYYNTAGTHILVSIGDGTNTPTAVSATLAEDKDATVADNHGWAGKKYTASGAGVDGTYEAVVYSNVEDPTEGAKFNSGTGDGNVGFATTGGVLALAAGTNLATRIASPSFDHSAGTKTFKLPDPNPQGATMITVNGSYYGVDGTYTCTPGTPADGCTVTRAEDGYTLDVTTDTWTFKATNPDARVTETEDTAYASYGWWLHKSADGSYTASAFADNKGAAPTAITGIHATLMGTATYMGGAAGKYALSSSTGGTNDAGHFTARAMLEADFNDDMVTGTIDNFMGADGQSRNWSVELKESGISDAGAIGSGTDAGGTDISMGETVWTIDGTAADAAGQWSGQLQESDDGVPEVATGTFYSTYGNAGKMVGAFGVNKQ